MPLMAETSLNFGGTTSSKSSASRFSEYLLSVLSDAGANFFFDEFANPTYNTQGEY